MGGLTAWVEGLGKISGWLATLGAISTALAAAFGWIKWIWPSIKEVYYTAQMARGLNRAWGPSAGSQIKWVLQDLTSRSGIDRVHIELLTSHLSIGVYVCDQDGRCTSANEALCRMFGLDSPAMLGHGWLLAVQNRQKVASDWQFAVANKIPYETAYVLVNQETQRQVCCHTRAIPTIHDGVVLSYVGVVEYADERNCPKSKGFVDKCPVVGGICPPPHGLKCFEV